MSRTRYRIFEHESPSFLTNTVVAWLPVFAHPGSVHLTGERIAELLDDDAAPA
jgi:hypothetical protein